MTAVQVLASQAEEREAETGRPAELTVAFTDLEDFTSFTAAEGGEAASRLLIGHHNEAAQIVRSRGGRLLKRLGDGLMLSFPEASAAVLARLELGEAAPLPLRAGVHAGSVQVSGDDLIGNVVNVAARLAESAEGRQVLVTQSARDAAGDLRGVVLDGPYSRTFKGVKEKVPVYLAARHASPCSWRPTPSTFSLSPTASMNRSASPRATPRSA
jgi:adenylate cyclase